MRLVPLLFALLIVGVAEARKDRCPAIPNTEMGWERGRLVIEALSEGKCMDLSDKCDKCVDKCKDRGYSHWIDKMCAQTCGLCKDKDETQLEERSCGCSRSSSCSCGKGSTGTFCWNYGSSYEGKDVLRSVPFTSVYDCEQLCLKEPACVGASITEFYRTPMSCVLAKSGKLLKQCSCRSKKFGATKECMRKSPLKTCSDVWNRCSCCMKNMCKARCPYYKSLLSKVCRMTCGYCDVAENGKGEAPAVKQWAIYPTEKLLGKPVKKFEAKQLEEAKAFCEKGNYGGVNCNQQFCNVIADIQRKVGGKGNTIAYTLNENMKQ